MSFMLPEPKPIITHRIPGAMIGDVFSVIEFHRIFANAFGEMQFSSHLRQLTLGDMEQGMVKILIFLQTPQPLERVLMEQIDMKIS